MRPHVLRLSAFGAYAGTQVFDLAELGPHRLFLIHGPTGSGKTTLLDAICFALFGESSGKERVAADLRSHHADAATATFVELDFALWAERYRIRRLPAQTVNGARGRPVKQNPQVTLWRQAPDGEYLVLAEQDRPVRDQVTALLGYTAEEFRQVVLLPQGRFRELLTAPPGQRQKILATLFRTAFYRRVEDAFEAMEKAARTTAIGLEGHRRTLLGEAGCETPEAAAEALVVLQAAAAEAAVAAAAAEGAGQEATAALQSARMVADRLRLAAEARDQVAVLESDLPRREAERVRLAAARRAQGLAGEEAQARALRLAADRAAADAATAADELTKARARLGHAQAALADMAGRDAAVRSAAAEAMRLDALAAPAGELAASATTARQAQTALEAAAAARAGQAEAVALANSQSAACAAALAAAQGLADRVAERQAVLARTESLVRDATAHRQQVAGLVGLERCAADARSAAEAAAVALLTARQDRARIERETWAGLAARLATTLADGAPCPVCGSRDHPALAHGAGDPGGDLEAARAQETACGDAERAAVTAQMAADSAVQAARTQRDGLAERLAEAGIAAPEQALGEARQALDLAARAAADLGSLTRKATAAAGLLREAEARLAGLEAQLTDLRRAADESRAAHATRLAAVPAEARDLTRLQQAIAAARRTAGALRDALDRDRAESAAATEALAAAADRATQAATRAREDAGHAATAEKDFLIACQAAGFADLAACQAAKMPAAALDALARELEAFRDRLTATRDLARRATADSEGLLPPDLPTQEASAMALAAAAAEARGRQGAARERAETAAALLARIRSADADFAVARDHAGLLAGMARRARGHNERRLSFEGFVLASLLDEALSAANIHLARMLDGRYRLMRRDDPARANAEVGVDIEVLDEWTGRPRASGTLSGGEGFCAALALALGLAETVQAHAGARPVDALFIDEGFGTLDEEALEKAMQVLADLHAGERIVGIISHVGELRSRIPAGLEVTPGARGSTARFVMR